MKPGVILGFFCVQRQPREVNHVILFQYPNSGGASTQHPEIQAQISTREAPLHNIQKSKLRSALGRRPGSFDPSMSDSKDPGRLPGAPLQKNNFSENPYISRPSSQLGAPPSLSDQVSVYNFTKKYHQNIFFFG